jgi:UDP-2,3-diacylglucosamine hydrolase
MKLYTLNDLPGALHPAPRTRIFFVSDLHLGASNLGLEAEKERRLSTFAAHLDPGRDWLILLGDLFEFWFEYRTVIPREHLHTIQQLLALRDKGLPILYFAGNHDFWLGKFFTHDLGIPLIPDALDLELGGKRFFIAHGDALGRGDWGYKATKKIFRNPVNIFLYRLIHPDLGIPLAKAIASLSRSKGQKPDAPFREYALKKLEEGYDGVVFGHTHRPQYLPVGDKVYLNTGNWFQDFTYGKWEAGKLSLETWKPD